MLIESDRFIVDLSASNAYIWFALPAYSILVQIWLSWHKVLGKLSAYSAFSQKYTIASWRTVWKISHTFYA